ncbi:helix-turn-helix domain-containing protein [Sphingobacterium bovisgrunnientis]|uniref:helix-turn-helix domain-containing protein n=1 Tax=Sphingobacterium bovisgrunnientis TaxID=1874697 RepID=UPI001357D67F|nr:helix-turn-helix transcriptional regulator [Sphingobacterium bovisgrunnientis]
MKAYNAKITTANIKNYFKNSGLTIEVFANVLDVSKRWLEYIFSENDKYEFTPKTIQKACEFFSTDFRKFTTEIQPVPDDLRVILKKKHLRNIEYTKILSDAPSIPFIIDKILIIDEEFTSSQGIELKYIKEIIWKYYPELKLTNLSSDLQKSDFIEHWPHPTKKNTKLYMKRLKT